jgi:hypothetical protein
MRNPYVLRSLLPSSLRSSLRSPPASLRQLHTSGPWDDLNADTRALILRFSDRRLEFDSFTQRDLPDELLPAENAAHWRASRAADGDPYDDEDNLEFAVDTIQKRVFARERHGILGPLTVSFSDCVCTQWYGFEGNEGSGPGGDLGLQRGPVRAALDYDETWTGITKIRLPLEVRPDWSFYRYELVREAHNGQRRDVITPPGHIFYIDASYGPNPPEKAQLAQALVEKLHLRHAVVNGVDEFSV